MTNDKNPFDDGWLDADDGIDWPADDGEELTGLAAVFSGGPKVSLPAPNLTPGEIAAQATAATPTDQQGQSLPDREGQSLPDREGPILELLKDVTDPELGVNVVDLGLVYGLSVSDDLDVTIDMTLTTPACPLTDQIEFGAQAALADVAKSVTVNWVWLPPWSLDMITEDGREQLRYIGYNL